MIAPNLHRPSGKHSLGLILAGITVFLWGILPLFLRYLVERMDPLTISWYRLLTAGGLLSIYLSKRDGIAFPRQVLGFSRILLFIAAGGLCGNYITYILSLRFVTPATAAVVIQLGPFFMLIGGLLIFRESFSLSQKIGVFILLSGLGLFFNRSIPQIFQEGNLSLGIIILIISGLSWAAYTMAQKQLLINLPSESIMWFVYSAGAVMLLPFINPGEICKLDSIGLLILAFCSLNTLVAYGCFSEALEHLEASHLGVIISLAPLITIGAEALGSTFFPNIIPAGEIGLLSLLGAGLVVVGSILGATGKKLKNWNR